MNARLPMMQGYLDYYMKNKAFSISKEGVPVPWRLLSTKTPLDSMTELNLMCGVDELTTFVIDLP